jgi:hypothetical protein
LDTVKLSRELKLYNHSTAASSSKYERTAKRNTASDQEVAESNALKSISRIRRSIAEVAEAGFVSFLGGGCVDKRR